MSKNNETITIELDENIYNKLVEIANVYNTTVEIICEEYLKLCAKEKGVVVWQNGFDKPYSVLKTKEEVEQYRKENE